MLSHEEEIAKIAGDMVDLQLEAEKFKQEAERAMTRHSNLMSQALARASELKKTVGSNIPERNVIVKGKLVVIRKDDVSVKDYILGKTGA